MWLFIVIKYLLLPNSDTFSHTQTGSTRVCLISSPAIIYHLHFSSTQGQAVQGAGAALSHPAALLSLDSTRAVPRFPAGSDPLRASFRNSWHPVWMPDQNPTSAQKPKPRARLLCSAPGEGAGLEGFGSLGAAQPGLNAQQRGLEPPHTAQPMEN